VVAVFDFILAFHFWSIKILLIFKLQITLNFPDLFRRNYVSGIFDNLKRFFITDFKFFKNIILMKKLVNSVNKLR
jgi:hypothetical protein